MPKETCKRTKSKTLVVFVVVALVDAMMIREVIFCCLNTTANKRARSRERFVGGFLTVL